MKILWLGACATCGGEVAFNDPAPETVRCLFGHRGPTPEERRAASPDELALLFDVSRTMQLELRFPYATIRGLYLLRFREWLAAEGIVALSILETPQRPWLAVFLFEDEGWPESDAMRATVWWRNALGRGLTGGNARALGARP